MNRSDVSRVGPRRDHDSVVLKCLEILQCDIVRLLDSIERLVRIIQSVLDSFRHLIRRQSCDIERSDHFRITPGLFFRRQIEFVGKGAPVAFEHDKVGVRMV